MPNGKFISRGKKMKGMKTLLAILMVLCIAGTLSAAGTQEKKQESDALKIAVILPGKVDDVSWNQALYDGMRKIEQEMGDQVAVTYVEEVYEVADIEPALMDFASSGYDLIFGHGFQFMEPIIKVAAQFPEVNFALGTGYKTLPNTCVYDVHLAQGGYLMGVLAASISETGKLGVIGGADVSEIYRGHEAYKLGAKSVNPAVEIQEFYTGDWRDSAKAKEGALGMYDSGVDVIWHSGDGIGLGAVNAALDTGKYVLSNVVNQRVLAPENVVSGVDYDWDTAIRQIIGEIQAGTFTSKEDKYYWLTVDNGGLQVADYGPFADIISAEAIQAVASAKQGMMDGSLVMPEFDK